MKRTTYVFGFLLSVFSVFAQELPKNLVYANEAFELELPLNSAFSKPTIAAFAEYVRETIMQLLEELDSE